MLGISPYSSHPLQEEEEVDQVQDHATHQTHTRDGTIGMRALVAVLMLQDIDNTVDDWLSFTIKVYRN